MDAGQRVQQGIRRPNSANNPSVITHLPSEYESPGISQSIGAGVGGAINNVSNAMTAASELPWLPPAMHQAYRDFRVGLNRDGRAAPQAVEAQAAPNQAIAPQAAAPQAVAPRRAPTVQMSPKDVAALEAIQYADGNAGFEPEPRGPNLDDLTALRERIDAGGGQNNLIVQEMLGNLQHQREQDYNSRYSADVQREVGLAGVNQRQNATDIQGRAQSLTERLKTLSDRDHAQINMHAAVIENTLSKPKDVKAAKAATLSLLYPEMNVDEQLANIDAMAPIQGKAEGGEITEMLGGMAPPEMPEAISTEPMQLDSGDYIIPVEAMRFYGRKFFQDLINKAEDAE